MESTSRQFSHREAKLIVPPDSEKAAVVETLTGSKAKKRGASRDVHESSRNTIILVANFILAITPSVARLLFADTSVHAC